MSAAHEALIWGYKILEKAFLGGTDEFPIDEEVGKLLQEASRYASSGEGLIDSTSPITSLPILTVDLQNPLLSIFPELFLHPQKREDDDEDIKGKFYILPKTALSDEENYPKLPADVADSQLGLSQKIKDDFKADAEAFGLIGSDLRQVPSDELLIMLEKYGATLPSKIVYISLFDYFRTVSAFAACIEKAENQPCFLLICADLSGIQDFVYGISSTGALKNLRVRSFFLEFAMEHVVTLLIETVGVSRANVVYRGGGKFFLLFPNSQSTRDAIDTIRSEMNRWFYDRFEGKIYLAIDAVTFDEEAVIWDEDEEAARYDAEASPFASFWRDGFDMLEKLKQQKFSDIFDSDLFVAIDPRSPRGEGYPNNDNECQISHREDMPDDQIKIGLYDDDDTVVSIDSYRLFHLGDNLTDFHYVMRFSKEPSRKGIIELPKGNGSSYFYTVSNQRPPANCDRVWVKNSLEIKSSQTQGYYDGLRVPFSLLLTSDVVVKADDLEELGLDDECKDSELYLSAYEEEEANYRKLTCKEDVTLPPETTVSMAGLAAMARGVKRVAALRMDVDNLGLLFAEGLHGKYRSLAHLSTLSRNLTYFFTHEVQRVCHGAIDCPTDISQRLARGASKRMVTMIYSGGDDLFLIGAWSDVPEVAIDIRQHFKKFTCIQENLISHQRFLSISAGITVHGPKFPLYRMALASKIAENLAKQIAPIGCERRDCLENWSECYLHKNRQEMKCKRKDSIALFVTDGLRQEAKRLNRHYETEGRIKFALSFDDFENRVLCIVKQFLALGEMRTQAFEPQFPHSFFQRLHLVTETWRKEGFLYVPALKWTLSRTANAMRLMEEEQEEFSWEEFSSSLAEKLIADEGEAMETFHQPLMWLGWLSRAQRDD